MEPPGPRAYAAIGPRRKAPRIAFADLAATPSSRYVSYIPAMAIRKIAQIGHPVLRQVAREVSREQLATPATQQFIDDLVETMRDADGAGLAAIQVYEPIRICAIEVRNNPRYPYKPPIPLPILVNPVLTPVDGRDLRPAGSTAEGRCDPIDEEQFDN